jgi:hypothetical protein
MNVGQTFWGFGWESLLAEAGFLAIFLGPRGTATPVLVLWAFRWVAVRLELGAGLIKLRGDPCWRDLTCLAYHHETQPLPNPLSWYFHHLPMALHKVEVAANLVAQLALPVLLFAPQPVAGAVAVALIVTQCWLLLSGNFSWLNVLTIVVLLAAVPDGWLGWLPGPPPPTHPASAWSWGVGAAVAAIVVLKSGPPLRNLFSARQAMNSSYDPLHLVNSYGAFGSITRHRDEVVIEATDDDVQRVDPDAATWRAYELPAKPGDPHRRPRQVAPYHLRLDWMLWFVGIDPRYGATWLDRLVVRLLEADPATLRLFRAAPSGQAPPCAVRILLYRYRFTTRAERRESGDWWHRVVIGTLVPPVRLDGAGRPVPVEPSAGSVRGPWRRT